MFTLYRIVFPFLILGYRNNISNKQKELGSSLTFNICANYFST